MKKLPTETMLSLRNENGNGFTPNKFLQINVTGHNGTSIIGSITVMDGNTHPPQISFALNDAKVLFIIGVGQNGIPFEYWKLIDKTQPELTENILLLYKNYQKNII